MNSAESASRHILPSTTEKVFWRGVEYAKKGSVKDVRERGSVVKAKVEGSAAYEVELVFGGPEGVRGVCMCAYALNSDYCKHVVALAAWWDLTRSIPLPGDEEAARSCLQAPHPRCFSETCSFCSRK